MYEPLGWKVTCFTGFGCSRRKSTFVMSLVSTTLTSVSLIDHQRRNFVLLLFLLACDCSPLPVGGNGEIANWYRTSSKKLIEGACIQRVHADGTIFGSGKEEVILYSSQQPALWCSCVMSVPKQQPPGYCLDNHLYFVVRRWNQSYRL